MTGGCGGSRRAAIRTIPIANYYVMRTMTQCRQCAIQMKLVSVIQVDEGLEDRVFECPKCHERDTRVFNSATGAASLSSPSNVDRSKPPRMRRPRDRRLADCIGASDRLAATKNKTPGSHLRARGCQSCCLSFAGFYVRVSAGCRGMGIAAGHGLLNGCSSMRGRGRQVTIITNS